MTVLVRLLAARVPATIDDGVWSCDDPDLKAILDLIEVLDAVTISYSPDADYAIAFLAVERLGGVIVDQEPIIANAPDGAEY